jgi:hypothetical protein
MSFEIEDDGLMEFLTKGSKLEGDIEVEIEEIFTSEFMSKYTSYSSFQYFLEGLGFEDVDTFINSIDRDKLDEFVKNHTSFNNYEEMEDKALEEYVDELMGFE